MHKEIKYVEHLYDNQFFTIIYQKFDILATQTSLMPLESIQRRHFSRARITCQKTKGQRCPSSRRDITKSANIGRNGNYSHTFPPV